MILVILLATAGCVALMIAGLGIKMLFRRSKSFRRPCANADPKTGHCAHCTCGKNKF